MNDDDLTAIEHRSELADAKLGVAEDLGWVAAGFAAVAIYLILDSWMAGIITFVGVYFLATFRYRKEVRAATDAYEKATGTGKYRVE
jgi:arginine exporter protein ArgO